MWIFSASCSNCYVEELFATMLIHRSAANVDSSYYFVLFKLSVLDYFYCPEHYFHSAVDNAYVLHDIDNIHCATKKLHGFIFCNNFIKTFYTEIIIGKCILQ